MRIIERTGKDRKRKERKRKERRKRLGKGKGLSQKENEPWIRKG